jgi:hypothetical protein
MDSLEEVKIRFKEEVSANLGLHRLDPQKIEQIVPKLARLINTGNEINDRTRLSKLSSHDYIHLLMYKIRCDAIERTGFGSGLVEFFIGPKVRLKYRVGIVQVNDMSVQERLGINIPGPNAMPSQPKLLGITMKS